MISDKGCPFLHVDVQQKDHHKHLLNIPDPESCYEKCLQHDSCEFFVWVSPDYSEAAYHYVCFLKWGNLSPPITSHTTMFGNYKDCRLPCTTFHAVDMTSDQFEVFYSFPDIETCSQKCLDHAYCEFFLWVPISDQQNECWLRWENLQSPVDNPGVLSNFKNCSATINV